MNSWSIRDCTLEKTHTSVLSVEKPSEGHLTCPLTDEPNAQTQLIFASNVGIAFSLCRKNSDTGVFIVSKSLTVLSVEKALRKCTCWVNMSWLTPRTASSLADSVGRCSLAWVSWEPIRRFTLRSCPISACSVGNSSARPPVLRPTSCDTGSRKHRFAFTAAKLLRTNTTWISTCAATRARGLFSAHTVGNVSLCQEIWTYT